MSAEPSLVSLGGSSVSGRTFLLHVCSSGLEGVAAQGHVRLLADRGSVLGVPALRGNRFPDTMQTQAVPLTQANSPAVIIAHLFLNNTSFSAHPIKRG